MKRALLLATCIFFSLLPWIFFDVDLGDSGHNSINAWMMAFHPPTAGAWPDAIPIWGSLFLDSLWWKLIGADASILYTRFAWILLHTTTATCLFFIFRRLYDERKVFTALWATVLIVTCAADHFNLSYNTIAPALGSISFSLFAVAYRHPVFLLPFFSGMLAVFTVHARLPSLPFVCLFFGGALMLHRTKKWIPLVVGALSGCILAALFLKGMGLWDLYIEGSQAFINMAASGSNERYSKTEVLSKVFGHYQKMMLGGLLLGVLILALSYFKKHTARTLAVGLAGFALLVGAKYGMALSILIGGSALILALRIFQERRNFHIEKYVLLLAGTVVTIAFSFGTNLEGIQGYKYSIWILFPFAFLEVESLKRFDGKSTRKFLIGACVLLFVITRFQWPTFPYLERNLFKMSKNFETDALRGIRSYPEKKAALDDLFTELAHRGLKTGDTLLCFTETYPVYPIAMIYAVTRTIPLFHNPGIIEYPGDRWLTNKAAIQDLAKTNQLPKIIVRQTQAFPKFASNVKSLLIDVWSSLPPTRLEPKNGLALELNAILEMNGYKNTWSNGYFEILSKY